MIKHIVTFIWREGVGEEEIAATAEQLRQLPGQIDALEEYTFGPDLRLTKGTGDFAVIATVADEGALRVYLEHPLHLPVAQRLREMAETRIAVQIGVEN